MHTPNTPKAVLAISSHVARGSVGLRAAGFAIERVGLPLWKVPTIWLPWHPGHTPRFGAPPRHAMPDDAFEASLLALVDLPALHEVGAVLTGYFASAGQVLATCKAIDRIRSAVPDVLVVCDPVSADANGAYVPTAVMATIRDELLPRCDVATPNRFEAAAFADRDDTTDNNGLVDAARSLGVPRVVVTSAFGLMKNAIGTLLVEERAATLAEHGLVPGALHGTGDLFSALLTAHLVSGHPIEKAMHQATASVFEMVARSVKAGSDELLIAGEQSSLVSPMAMVTTRHLAAARAT